MSTNKPIGLITYHSAYNFGSVLQAYGTIRSIEKLGYEVETIDYQTISQMLWYYTDFSMKKGIRSLINDFGFNFIKRQRRIRAGKYDDFIKNNLHPSKEKYHSFEDFNEVPNYEVLVSGSDQVWNIGCGEFTYEPFEAILPYFLRFGNPRKRIAYASSFGDQNLRNIRKYADLLNGYDALSTREPIARGYMEKATGRKVELVCDPTWLLNKTEWQELKGVYKPATKRPYIFVYALYWYPWQLHHWIKSIKSLANNQGWDVVCVSPLNYYNDNSITMLQDAGPVDFISYLLNAAFVVTNTFHGTIFSMNFEKPFFSCGVQPGSRQGQMLALCELEDRIVTSPKDLEEADDLEMDFTESSNNIQELRNSSLNYLRIALDDM